MKEEIKNFENAVECCLRYQKNQGLLKSKSERIIEQIRDQNSIK